MNCAAHRAKKDQGSSERMIGLRAQNQTFQGPGAPRTPPPPPRDPVFWFDFYLLNENNMGPVTN